jgi:colanic acid/amylovoran biosynthesis glycosyltransferase
VRVGYVLRYFPALSETFVAREIRGLRARGIHVDVAALGRRSSLVDADDAAGVDVFRPPRGLARLGWPRRGDWRLLAWQRPKDVFRATWLRALARERRWDRVHVHFAGEALEVAVAADLGLPLSVTAHAVDLFRPRPSLPVLLKSCQVVTVCEHHRRHLQARWGIDAMVVRCGVTPGPAATASPERSGLPLICVARDVPKKDLDGLVAALPPSASLRLVSDARRLASPRVVVGELRPDAVPAALAAAQLFVLPCRVAPDGDRDGVPEALMEAMAAGLPVVSTDVSGVPELVDASVGWLVPPGDRVALRETLERAMGAPDERRARGLAGRERVLAGWTVDQQVEGLLAAWRP